MKKHKSLYVSSFLLSILLFFVIASGVAAQTNTGFNFKIMRVDDTAFPLVNVYVSVLDNQGHLIERLTTSNFTLQEDGKNIPKFTVSTGINSQQPLTIIIAVDIGQTSEEEFAVGIEAASKFVETLPDQDMVGIIAFSDEVKVLKEVNSDKHRIPAILNNLETGGESNLYDGLIASVELLEELPGPKAIVVFSNGLDSGLSEAKPKDVIEAASVEMIQIYPFGFKGFGSEVYPSKLDPLAEDTGGLTIYLPGKKDQIEELEEAFDQLLIHLDEILRFQYILRYDSPSTANGSKHVIKSTVNYLGWQDEDDHTFIACPGVVKVCLPDYDPAGTIASNACLVPVIHTPDPPVKKLDVAMDGKALCSDTIPPFECCLDPSAIEEGKHGFKFVVLDSANKTGELNTSLYVRPAVIFNIKSPKEGQRIITGKLKVASTLDSLLPLEKVQFLVGNEVLYEDSPAVPAEGPPYIYTYNEDLNVGTITGDKTLRITALDTKNSTSEGRVNVIFSPLPPSVNWLAYGVIIVAIGAVLVLLLGARRRRRRIDGAILTEGNAVLQELEGLYPNQTWPLTTEEVRLGRKSKENDIPLKGVSASRYMATVRFVEGFYYIYSLKPENPVLVNNIPVYQQQVLEPGDMIQMGESLFRYEVAE